MVVTNNPTAKECLKRMKELHIALMLDDSELGQDLEASNHVRMRIDPDIEATFPVHKPCHPSRIKL